VCGSEAASIMAILALSQPYEKLCGRRQKMFQLLKRIPRATNVWRCMYFISTMEGRRLCRLRKHGHNFSLCKYFVQRFSDGRWQFIML
jgi:hypothetical protein